MSWRTWLGSEPAHAMAIADFNLCEVDSMKALCAQAAWRLPAKVFSPDRDRLEEFLRIMEDEHGMTFDDFWTLKVGGMDGPWVDFLETPTRASIEVMAMVGEFVTAYNEEVAK